jgi:TolA-binding protein
MSTHLDRKELKRPDAFLSKAEMIVHFANTNSRTILAALGILFSLGLAIAVYTNAQSKKSVEAAGHLFLAKKDLAAALAGVPKDAADWETKAAKALDELNKVGKDFNGTLSGTEAQLLAGDTYYDHGNFAKAADYYRDAVKSADSKSSKAFAEYSLGYALEQTKQYDAAASEFQRIVSSGDKALRPDAMVSLARNLELKGDKAKAKEQYDLVIKEFPGTPVARTAEAQKKALGQ